MFLVLYALIDFTNISSNKPKIKKYALIFKEALFWMTLCSFAIWYAVENFLALTITIVLHIWSLYFDWHSKFRNKWTDFFFSVSIILIVLMIVLWILALVILYLKFIKFKKNSFAYTLVDGLRRTKNTVVTFYSCFFVIRIIVTVLVFLSE